MFLNNKSYFVGASGEVKPIIGKKEKKIIRDAHVIHLLLTAWDAYSIHLLLTHIPNQLIISIFSVCTCILYEPVSSLIVYVCIFSANELRDVLL